LLDLLMRQDSGNYRVADVGSGAARRGSTPRAPNGDSNQSRLRQLSRYVPASETWQRVGSYPEPRGSNQRRRLRSEPVL